MSLIFVSCQERSYKKIHLYQTMKFLDEKMFKSIRYQGPKSNGSTGSLSLKRSLEGKSNKMGNRIYKD